METGSIVGSIDVAQVTLYAFWVFFASLIWYIRKEDRREGYPLENDTTRAYNKDPWLFLAAPKTFVLPHGNGTVSFPNNDRDTRPIAAERTARFPGAPLQPTGDPMLGGVGPGSWAERADRPDQTHEGTPKIVPMRVATDYSVAAQDKDPRGMRVFGCDKALAGTVTDIWVDRSEQMIRYLEVEIGADEAKRTVLLPMTFCVYKEARGGVKVVYVHAITSEQFANVPGLAGADQVTLLEEEKVVAYYGAGQLYATPQRAEPLV
jgi:photosynthetic reaction center H subunit